MAFLRNDAVNRVNLHYGIQAFALGAGGVFFLAFLLHAGFSIAATLCTLAAILALRFALRPLIVPLGKRIGLKPMVIIGAVVIAFQYPILPFVHGIGLPLAALIFVSAVGDTFYWPSYHAYFAAVGDTEHRGHQVGAREALAAAVGIIAPLLGAYCLITAGPWPTFCGVALVQASSALPLLGAPNVPVVASAPGVFRAAQPGLVIFCADGWVSASFFFVWQVVLFVSLGQNLGAFGGAMALAALAGAIIGLLLGRHIDQGHGQRAAVVAYAVLSGVVALRAASLNTPWLAVIANAAGALAVALVIPSAMTALYNLAKASPCPFRFHVYAEGAWDAGCASGCLTAAALSAQNAPMAIALLTALPGAIFLAVLLWRYYGAHPAVIATDIHPLPAGARQEL
jgi:DHA1 family inner membrane transport protein